jgi:hypothetical protein
MKKYNNTPVPRIRLNTPFLSIKWRGNSQLNRLKGSKIR